jgi:hypothetical protein
VIGSAVGDGGAGACRDDDDRGHPRMGFGARWPAAS